ncbi:solute carrier organic anion transporter family member 5A1b isoform X2 [Megalobrama amblycephala]|uniref:solute carrier organic anion transporter family member 5A1b isoform X2 n=1 Tax=Megalobrama amblycephala TaxID=75352 RepID=UPI002014185C|nr:solute carrier organic anion transporter family member 5A1b isoform X2 [Megalobrama amblycephala]
MIGRMDSFHLFLAILAFRASLVSAADRKFGCLFEEGLCLNYEVCLNDGMLGRCEAAPLTEVYTYDVTPATVQRFRMLLQRLAHRGLSWEDDVTQQVLANEFSKLRKVSLPLPEPRPQGYGTAVGDRRMKSSEAGVRKTLKYLQHLGLLPKTSHKGAELQYYRPGEARPATDSSPPEFIPEVPYQSKSYPDLSRYQSDAAQAPQQQEGLDLLVAALQKYLSKNKPPQPDLGGRSRADRLFLKDGSTKSSASDSLTPVDESFIWKVLQNVGRHSVDVKSLKAADLDKLAVLIADALQVVEQQAGQGETPRDLETQQHPEDEAEDMQYEDQHPESYAMDQTPKDSAQKQREADEESSSVTQKTDQTILPVTEGQTVEEEKRTMDNKEVGFLGKLLEYLDKTSSPDTEPVDKGRGVSVETVRSRTTHREVGMQKKAIERVEEVEGWVQAAAIAPSSGLKENPAPHRKNMKVEDLQLDVQSNAKNDIYGYIITDTENLSTDRGLRLMELLARKAKIQMTDFSELSVVSPAVTFQVRPNAQNITTTDVANVAVHQKGELEKEAEVKIVEAGVTDRSKLNQIPTKYSRSESMKFLILTVISIICITGVLLASSVVYCLRHRSHHKLKEKLTNLGSDTTTDATATYQELCRQRMAVKPPVEKPDPIHSSRINSVSSQLSDGPIPSPSARTSTSSWSEEPAHSNMDISTGHMILAYMEDHLKNKNRLESEWEALCAYQAEPNATTIGQRDGNVKKNRISTVIAYDHCRITLKVENNQGNSDYINASPIMDHDPRNPAYIATQGPLPSTVADFWQMVWESGCVVIVMLTPLSENGVKQCYHYWPDEGSNLYHIYEVNLVSEHVWCDDFLVRSFYLKNMQTNETRTVTQFHYHTWLNDRTPETSQTLLDFRRKVNKCYRGRSCPVIVHCSDGAGRTGTYILIDMVLNKMAKGAKEIDIAATLEHLRDQRPGMVQTKDQFEFALTTVAEEVNAILKVLPQ